MALEFGGHIFVLNLVEGLIIKFLGSQVLHIKILWEDTLMMVVFADMVEM